MKKIITRVGNLCHYFYPSSNFKNLFTVTDRRKYKNSNGKRLGTGKNLYR